MIWEIASCNYDTKHFIDKLLGDGWEPFAITWVPLSNELTSNRLVQSNTQRWWFKKKAVSLQS